MQVFCCGGLGNQMFQYAFVLYLEEAGNDVQLNIWDYSIHFHHNGFELKKVFNITNRISEEKLKRLNVNSIINRFLYKLFGVRLFGKFDCVENYNMTYILPQKYDPQYIFYGFWQNAQYVECVGHKIRSEFSFRKLNEKNEKFYSSICHRETVSVHVRRGDYLSHTELCGICNLEYYQQAIDYIKKQVSEPVFVVFSDDILWCKEVFKNEECFFVDWNKGEDSYVDMQLMSMCRHNIIANSTFSWWGAYLNSHSDKIVVMPKKWINNDDKNNLMVDGWIGL